MEVVQDVVRHWPNMVGNNFRISSEVRVYIRCGVGAVQPIRALELSKPRASDQVIQLTSGWNLRPLRPDFAWLQLDTYAESVLLESPRTI